MLDREKKEVLQLGSALYKLCLYNERKESLMNRLKELQIERKEKIYEAVMNNTPQKYKNTTEEQKEKIKKEIEKLVKLGYNPSEVIKILTK